MSEELVDTTERDRDIVRRREEGQLLSTIADAYGISRERVRRILIEQGVAEEKPVVE